MMSEDSNIEIFRLNTALQDEINANMKLQSALLRIRLALGFSRDNQDDLVQLAEKEHATIAAQAEEIKRLKEQVKVLRKTLVEVSTMVNNQGLSRRLIDESLAATEPKEPTQPAASLRSE